MRLGVDPDRIRRASDAFAGHLVSPNAAAGTVCEYCRTWLPEDTIGKAEACPAECENCVEVRDALDTTPLSVSMVSLYSKPSALRDILTRYKGRDDEDDPFDPRCVEIIQAILGRVVLEHGAALQQRSGGIDALVVVPSTDRMPPHPLEAVIESLALDTPLLRLLERGDGDMKFRKPDRHGFRPAGRHSPARVLLVDDVYTTGSRLNSAAVALRDAGHTISGALVLARRINPTYSDEATHMWVAASAVPFDWRTSPWIQ